MPIRPARPGPLPNSTGELSYRDYLSTFLTDNSYLDNPTFRGMRRSLIRTFDVIYLLALHGNSKKKERALDGGKDENVFDIMQGVAICLMLNFAPAT